MNTTRILRRKQLASAQRSERQRIGTGKDRKDTRGKDTSKAEEPNVDAYGVQKHVQKQCAEHTRF